LMDARVKPGHDTECVARICIHSRFSFQTANASPPCCLSGAGFACISFPRNMRGAERRKALVLSDALRRRVPCDRDARLSALHRGVFLPTAGPAFSEAFRASAVSQLLAGGLSASGGSPAAARVQGYEPCPQAPRLTPSFQASLEDALD